METGEFWQLAKLSDARLRSGLSELLASGYRTEARIIAHLAEVEQRKLHLKDGSESLYDYCTRRLRLSNSEAFHRITAARIARNFPIVYSLIEQRQLHLTAVCLLRDYLHRFPVERTREFPDLQQVKVQKFTGPLPHSGRGVLAFSITPTALGCNSGKPSAAPGRRCQQDQVAGARTPRSPIPASRRSVQNPKASVAAPRRCNGHLAKSHGQFARFRSAHARTARARSGKASQWLGSTSAASV